ncbi:hypothetical protein JW948_08110 [bacterium]|nr:hypothetical protein [bacterium]
MQKFCQSCGMPLNAETTGSYCHYCTDDQGQLKPREAVAEGIAAWLEMFTPDDGNVNFKKRAESYLAAMPAWAEV